jgi:hypothetical protein
MTDELDVNGLLSEYFKDATHFISTPEILKQLINEGLKLDEQKSITDEEYNRLAILVTKMAPGFN